MPAAFRHAATPLCRRHAITLIAAPARYYAMMPDADIVIFAASM